jgi:hypothetical protein
MPVRCLVLAIVAAIFAYPVDAQPDASGSTSAVQEFLDFLKEGTVKADIRARWENARIDDMKVANAATLRTRLGYGTKPWKGLSVFAEFENVASANDSIYYDGVGTDNSDRTIVADPTVTELNQAYGDLDVATLATILGILDMSGTTAAIRGGRQRVIFDDARFIGNVGWRQNEQTFDAVKGTSSLGLDDLTASYVYVWEARRIYGDKGVSGAGTRNYGGDSHFVNLRFDRFDAARLTAFAYLMDFGNSPAATGVSNSSNTTGSGSRGPCPCPMRSSSSTPAHTPTRRTRETIPPATAPATAPSTSRSRVETAEALAAATRCWAATTRCRSSSRRSRPRTSSMASRMPFSTTVAPLVFATSTRMSRPSFRGA